MIFPHRVKLDLSLDTDVLSRGEEFSPKRHINVGRDSPATFCASASALSLHDEVVSITQGEPLSMNQEATSCHSLRKADERVGNKKFEIILKCRFSSFWRASCSHGKESFYMLNHNPLIDNVFKGKIGFQYAKLWSQEVRQTCQEQIQKLHYSPLMYVERFLCINSTW